MKILMTGATGWVARELGIELVRRGHEIVGLARNSRKAKSQCPFPARWYDWNYETQDVPAEALNSVDAILHLMGEPVAEGRWSEERKARIRSSRVQSTVKLMQAAEKSQISTFVSASAIGFYGDRADEELSEESPAGHDFLARVCEEWEAAVMAPKSSMRRVCVRIGIVLGRGGGALAKMLPAFQSGVGGPLASGRQWMSWIHIQDLRHILIEALEKKSYAGVLNATAPEPVRQMQFASELGKALGRPAFLPTPGFALKIMFGEMAEVLLSSSRVLPQSVLKFGFKFQYSTLNTALADILEPEMKGEKELLAYQFVDSKKEKIFPFFSDEKNLEKITPPFLNFHVIGKSTEQIQTGTLIDYKLKLHGVPVRWRTEIQDWNPPHQFVDLQLKGPYKKWHHTHSFEDLGSGTLMTDRVRYKLPMGFWGDLLGGWKVTRDVGQIFEYRRKVIEGIFP